MKNITLPVGGTMADLIAAVFSVFLFALGWSYILQAPRWFQLARKLLDEPEKILLLSIFLLPMGLVIIFGHNIWVWEWRVAVTLLGWSLTIKYAFYLLWPQSVEYFRGWLDKDLTQVIRVMGVLFAVAGAASSWQVLCSQAG